MNSNPPIYNIYKNRILYKLYRLTIIETYRTLTKLEFKMYVFYYHVLTAKNIDIPFGVTI